MTYASEVLADSPLIYWRLGDASGTTAVDSSGNGRNGTYVGSPTLGVAGLLTGDADTAVTFDGSNDEVTYADTTDLTNWSIEAWVKTSASGTPQIVASRYNSTSTEQIFALLINASGLPSISLRTASGTASTTGAVAINDGARHHVAATFENSTDTVRLYVDGTQVSSTTRTGNPLTFDTVFRVGSWGIGTNWFNGTIDEVAYYTTAVSAARLLAHYTAGSSAPPANEVVLDAVMPSIVGALEIETSRVVTFDAEMPPIVGSIFLAPSRTVAVDATMPSIVGVLALDSGRAEVQVAGIMPAIVGDFNLTSVVEAEVNRAGGWVRDNIGEASWTPAVAAPVGPQPENRVVAFAYPAPTFDGTQVSLDITELSEPAYRDRIVVNGKDISFWRGVATPPMDWQRIQPLGHGAGTLRLPQAVVPFETPGEGDLSWLTEDASVLVQSVDPETNEVVGGRDWRGFVVTWDVSGGELVVECGGHAAGLAALQDRQMQLIQQRPDAGLLVARAMRNIGLKHEPWAGTVTGIPLIRWGGGNLLDYINELVAKMTTVDGDQWTVMPDDDDIYRTTLRDNTTVHGTVYFDDARIKPSLRRDMSEEPNRIFASGITPAGMAVKFGMYPGLIQGPAAPYPMADNSTFGIGTTNGDTDTGDGITIMGWQLTTAGYLDPRPSHGTYDAEVARAIKALQRDAGLSQTGNMSTNTWKALYNLSVTGYSLRNIRIRPAAQDTEVNPWRQSSNGSIIARNPAYKPSKKRRDRTVAMGSGLKRGQIREYAEALLPDGPQWRGTIEINTGAIIAGEHTPGDPIVALLRDRDIWPGMNIWAPLWAGGTLFHVAGVSVTNERNTVTLAVDTRPGNTLQVWEAIQRDRESRNTVHRSFFRDRRASSFDRENTYDEVGGTISPIKLNPGNWTVFPVVAKQAGVIERIRLNLSPNREFVVVVTARKITPRRLRAVTNAPLTLAGRKQWTEENVYDKLNRDYVVLYVAGNDQDPCGYFPGRKSEGDSLTGRWDDQASFPFVTLANNRVDRSSVLHVAVWVGDSATVDGGRIMWPSAEDY